ncbi:MAG TPA: amidohydrolase family protein [Acetobacteraceae bacterium]|jgi:predicted TIM-barrel fold metal-dependent hydrolase|nr:amidohydrolase family protein [Acetobacteraceae bacterium]
MGGAIARGGDISTGTDCACCDAVVLGRRGFLAGASALAATAAWADDKPHRIDVHHHIVPPTWLEALRRAKLDNALLTAWTPQRSIDDMDRAGIATAITSPTTPQVGFLPAADAARVAHESNEYARQLMADHPGRFGVFAMLPMPYPDECLKEIDHVFDTLKVDGIGMMTSYGDKWLGHPQFTPVFDELNRRKATVYTHPTVAGCCGNLVPGISDATVEYGADTTRSIVNLVFSGAAQRYPDINFIFSHGGGVLTSVAERLQIQMVSTPPYKGKFTREMVDAQLRRFYYDTAQVANAVTIRALANLVPVTQIVFGTDYPYRSGTEYPQALAANFTADELKAIDRENAVRILPRLRTA